MTDTMTGSAQENSKQKEQQDNVFSGEKTAEKQEENTFSGQNEADGSFNGNREGKEKAKRPEFEYGKAIDLGGDTNAADFFINQIMTLNLFSQVMSRVGPNVDLISRVASSATETLQTIRDKLRERKLKKELYAPAKPSKKKDAEDKKQKKEKEKDKDKAKGNKKKKNLKQHGQEAQNRKKEKEQVKNNAKRKSNVRAGSKQRVSDLKDLKKSIMQTNNRANQNSRTNQNNRNRAPFLRDGRS